MLSPKRLFPIAAAALLAACEARVGTDETAPAEANAADAGSLEGSSEEGTFSMDLPGFDMKIRIPEGMQDQVDADGGDLLPPGATFRGIHIQGNDGGGEDGVELRFSDSRAPQELAQWYRAETSGREFSVTSAERQGDAFVIAGETSQDRDTFTVRLSPRDGGGTDGRLAIVDRGR